VSLASLESIALPAPERSAPAAGVLRDVSFTAPSGQLTALVGPSGAGKTTITALAARLYDPDQGAVRIGGHDLKEVALARLLLKAPSVVVLDEATAHLDSESEIAVQQALKSALAGRTSLVIAHRLSTVRDADQILVVADGRIIEQGTHAELLAVGGLYADLYHTQFAGQPA
jgi:ABC-type multidrug transport system fused ATPase/permease subunit